MASAYPAGLDTFATNKANATATTTDHPTHHNDLADAVNKIEAELGVAPSGAAATVVARLDAISGGDIIFADVLNADTNIASVSDVTVHTTDVAGVVAGDLLVAEYGFTLLNDSGTGRIYTFTPDFDGVFMCLLEMGPQQVQHATDRGVYFIRSTLAVLSTSSANYLGLAHVNPSVAATGSSINSNNGLDALSWDTSASNLTGTVTVDLKARSDGAVATQTVTLNSVTIRKIAST